MGGLYTDKFAEFTAKTRYEELPREVIDQARLCILDFLGVALAGSNLGLSPLMTEILSREGGEEECSVIGHHRKMPVLNAALLNGVRGHTLDMDDGHRYANAHPAVTVIPAALAVAEKCDATMKDLIESVVAGYEVFVRIARAVNPSHLQRGFHSTGTVGPFGAATACCKLLGLDAKQIESALAIAALQGAGLLQALDSGQMMKPLHPGRAAQAGVLAALLAQGGAQGPDEILEGAKAWFKAYADNVDTKALSEGLGRDFAILGVYFKWHAACRHVHSTLDALVDAVNTHNVALDEIEKIEVGTYPVAYSLTGTQNRVSSELAAKFSIPVSVALMLFYKDAGVDVYSEERLKEPVLQGIADRVSVRADAWRGEVYPAKRGAEVKVYTQRGIFSGKVEIPKGDPENPFSPDELKKKFLNNASKALSPADSMRLADLVTTGDPADRMSNIMALAAFHPSTHLRNPST